MTPDEADRDELQYVAETLWMAAGSPEVRIKCRVYDKGDLRRLDALIQLSGLAEHGLLLRIGVTRMMDGDFADHWFALTGKGVAWLES